MTIYLKKSLRLDKKNEINKIEKNKKKKKKKNQQFHIVNYSNKI